VSFNRCDILMSMCIHLDDAQDMAPCLAYEEDESDREDAITKRRALPPRASTLPCDALTRIYSQLGHLRDITSCSLTCRSWNAAAAVPSLWKEIAVRRYGAEVASRTVGAFYSGRWRDMVADDNLKGALPTLYGPWFMEMNSSDRLCEANVGWVKWHRPLGEVWLAIDARGDADLCHPASSAVIEPKFGVYIFPVRWKAEKEIRGHFKGVLAFPDKAFRGAGKYRYCYDSTAGSAYPPFDLFSIPPEDEGGLGGMRKNYPHRRSSNDEADNSSTVYTLNAAALSNIESFPCRPWRAVVNQKVMLIRAPSWDQ